jgi:hypothetical protein
MFLPRPTISFVYIFLAPFPQKSTFLEKNHFPEVFLEIQMVLSGLFHCNKIPIIWGLQFSRGL